MLDDRLDHIRPLSGLPPNNRGRQEDVHPGDEKWLVDSRNGCQQGEVIGVTLGLRTRHALEANEGPQAGFTYPQIRARLEFGSGGTELSALVDFLSGVTFGVCCEQIKVGVEYKVLSRPWALECNPRCCPPFVATALLGYGRAGCGARLTELAQIEKPNQVVLIPIPQFAISMTVLPINGSQVAATLLPCSEGYAVRDVIVAPLSNLGQSNRIDQIPIAGGMRHVVVENRQTEGSAYAFVVFALSFI